MSKKVLFAALMLGFTLAGMARSSQEEVCLKDGSALNGTSMDMVSNEPVKMQAQEGNMLVYKDISKITKEVNGLSQDEDDDEPAGVAKRGYKGFLGFGVQNWNGKQSSVSVFTSHGYQFNSHIFLGGGVACLIRVDDNDYRSDNDYYRLYKEDYYYYRTKNKSGNFFLPVYAHFRYNLLSKRVSPFIEAKEGYSLVGITGIYAEVSSGLRIGVGRKGQAVNVALGGIVLGNKGEKIAGNFKVFFEF